MRRMGTWAQRDFSCTQCESIHDYLTTCPCSTTIRSLFTEDTALEYCTTRRSNIHTQGLLYQSLQVFPKAGLCTYSPNISRSRLPRSTVSLVVPRAASRVALPATSPLTAGIAGVRHDSPCSWSAVDCSYVVALGTYAPMLGPWGGASSAEDKSPVKALPSLSALRRPEGGIARDITLVSRAFFLVIAAASFSLWDGRAFFGWGAVVASFCSDFLRFRDG